MSSSALAEISYGAAVRALDLQERAVEQLRSRTGTLLVAASLTASFLGAQTIQHTGNFETLEVLALLSMVASISLCVYVLLPKSGFVFGVNAAGTYEQLYEFRHDEEELQPHCSRSWSCGGIPADEELLRHPDPAVWHRGNVLKRLMASVLLCNLCDPREIHIAA